MSKPKYKRYRFQANEDDPRPVIFPPPGPYWVSGWGDGYSVLVAYLPRSEKLKKYWPEATDIEFTEETHVTFTDRFPPPDWFDISTLRATNHPKE